MREKLNSPLFLKLRHELLTRELISKGDVIVLALSGGRDSLFCCCFLWWLKAIHSFDLRAVHINHGLRGAEDAKESEFLQAFCARLKIPYREVAIDVGAREAELGSGLENAARSLRQEVFAGIQQEVSLSTEKPCKIALAHQRDDVAESILLQMSRGTGLAGLIGMREQEGIYIRPILSVSREEITEYLAKRELPWLEDHTNAELNFTRNRIRHELLPLWSDLVDRDMTDALWKLSNNLKCVLDFVHEKIDLDRVFGPDGAFSWPAFKKLSPAEQQLSLVLFFKREDYEEGLTAAQITMVLNRLREGRGEASFDLTGGRRLIYTGDRLYFANDTK